MRSDDENPDDCAGNELCKNKVICRTSTDQQSASASVKWYGAATQRAWSKQYAVDVGDAVGEGDGLADGAAVGMSLGDCEGDVVGMNDGEVDGKPVGAFVGTSVMSQHWR